MAKSKYTAAERKAFKPGGSKGKLHRELGIPEGEKIPAKRLEAAAHSSNPEVKRDAIRAKTMKGWQQMAAFIRLSNDGRRKEWEGQSCRRGDHGPYRRVETRPVLHSQ